MSRIFLNSLASLGMAAALAVSAAPANAGHRHHHGGHGGDPYAAGVAGVVLGAMLGAPRPYYAPPPPYYYAPAPVYIEPAPVYVQPAPIYVEPAPIYGVPDRVPYSQIQRGDIRTYRDAPPVRRDSGPRVVTYEDSVGGGSLEPWSAGWIDYCSDKYRTFDSRTGTYKGYDGLKHFCVAD